MRLLYWLLVAALLAGSAAGADNSAPLTGPPVGSPIPPFTAKDQNGVERTSASLLGPKGALLVFFRSADW